MIVTAMKIFLTLSTPCHVPERAVIYADLYTTFQKVAQFFVQIAKRRSRMSNCAWRTCIEHNCGDQRDSTCQTLWHCVLTSCSSLLILTKRASPHRSRVPNLSLTMYHLSILTDEHVPLQHFES